MRAHVGRRRVPDRLRGLRAGLRRADALGAHPDRRRRRHIRGAGAAAFESAEINNVMTGDREWEEDGLGRPGETYLAGPDRLMRSVSRELLVNPKQFQQDVVANGTPAEIAKREVEIGDSILLQPVEHHRGEPGAGRQVRCGHGAKAIWAPRR